MKTPRSFSRHLALLAGAWLLCASNILPAAEDSAAPVIKVSCVGDSITAGYGLPQGAKSYPKHLQEILGPGYEVKNFGASARTLQKNAVPPSYWQCKEWQAAQDFQPAAVVIILGTNDSKPKNFENIKNLSDDARDMIRVLRQLPSHPVILIGLPPPVYKSNFGINEENMVKIRRQLEQVADQEKVPTVDLSKALANHSEWFPDGIHPNVEGVEALAKAISEPLTAAVKAGQTAP